MFNIIFIHLWCSMIMCKIKRLNNSRRTTHDELVFLFDVWARLYNFKICWAARSNSCCSISRTIVIEVVSFILLHSWNRNFMCEWFAKNVILLKCFAWNAFSAREPRKRFWHKKKLILHKNKKPFIYWVVFCFKVKFVNQIFCNYEWLKVYWNK